MSVWTWRAVSPLGIEASGGNVICVWQSSTTSAVSVRRPGTDARIRKFHNKLPVPSLFLTSFRRDHSTHHLAIQPSRSAQPQPNVLEISIHNHPALCLRNLITRHLQEEHGNLNLPHPSPQTLPPLSPLGHSLTTSHRVPELLNHLVTKSAGNPFLCLARLEHIRDAKSAEEALATADRLPSNIVNVLRAGVDRIISSLPAELLNLAMDALIEVANSGTADGMEWEELVEVLEERGHEDVSEERILFATGGFLKCYPMGGSVSIKCFCDDFALFVEQNYHEGLSRRARSLEQQGEEEEEERG